TIYSCYNGFTKYRNLKEYKDQSVAPLWSLEDYFLILLNVLLTVLFIFLERTVKRHLILIFLPILPSKNVSKPMINKPTFSNKDKKVTIKEDRLIIIVKYSLIFGSSFLCSRGLFSHV
ncbi:hypothetical protein ACWF2S_21510, partial [Bacillus subtilis]